MWRRGEIGSVGEGKGVRGLEVCCLWKDGEKERERKRGITVKACSYSTTILLH